MRGEDGQLSVCLLHPGLHLLEDVLRQPHHVHQHRAVVQLSLVDSEAFLLEDLLPDRDLGLGDPGDLGASSLDLDEQ